MTHELGEPGGDAGTAARHPAELAGVLRCPRRSARVRCASGIGGRGWSPPPTARHGLMTPGSPPPGSRGQEETPVTEMFALAAVWLALAILSTILANRLKVSMALVEICVGMALVLPASAGSLPAPSAPKRPGCAS